MTTKSAVVNLESREGCCFEVPIKVACLSGIIGEIIKDDEAICDEESILLTRVSSDVLHKFIEFGKHYQEEQMTPILPPLVSPRIEDLVQKWYAEFVNLPLKQLFKLAEAAHYLDIEPLLSLTVYAIATHIKGKSAAELREIFTDSSETADEGNGSAATEVELESS